MLLHERVDPQVRKTQTVRRRQLVLCASYRKFDR